MATLFLVLLLFQFILSNSFAFFVLYLYLFRFLLTFVRFLSHHLQGVRTAILPPLSTKQERRGWRERWKETANRVGRCHADYGVELVSMLLLPKTAAAASNECDFDVFFFFFFCLALSYEICLVCLR